MSRPAYVWVPCPPSDAPPGGETPQGIYPTRGSEPTSPTQTGARLATPPHRTSPSFSYPIPPLPRSSPAFPISPAPSGGSIPPPENNRQWTTTFVRDIKTKRPPSAVSHTTRRTSPYAPPSTQQPTSITSSPSYSGIFFNLGAPD